jgi:hypothetical protein
MRRGGTEKQSQQNKTEDTNMNAPTIKTSNTSYKTGLTPVPVETHKKAIFEGQMKLIFLGGI